MRGGSPFVRLEIRRGDELEDVLYVACQAATLRGLQAFRNDGQCDPALREDLRALIPEALPAVRAPLEELDRSFRNYLCAAYLRRHGRAASVVETFAYQEK